MTRDQFRFFFPYRVRYSDIDSQRVIYFAQFFVIANAALHEYYEWLEFPYLVGGWQEADTDFHFAHTSADYRQPIAYDERLELGVRTGRLGTSSITIEIGFFREGEDAAAVEVTMVMVNFDKATGRPQALPDDFAAKLKDKEGITRGR